MRFMAKVLMPLFISMMAAAQPLDTTMTVYLIPGQGGDHRLFSELELPGYETQVLEFMTPDTGEMLPEYAKRMAEHIDTSRPYSIVGVSLGGMCAVEMGKLLSPEKLIIISSAKGPNELPWRIRNANYIPGTKYVGGRFMMKVVNLARPMVEPESKSHQAIYTAMINAKDPVFMKRASEMIMNWEYTPAPQGLVHIHGKKDHTVPYRNVKDAIPVEGGHLIVLSKAAEVSRLILKALEE